MKNHLITLPAAWLVIFTSCGQVADKVKEGNQKQIKKYEVSKSNEEWKKELDPATYHVTREKGTEPAFSGKYYNHHENGMYTCSNCGNPLFSSDTKFESGSGWPSFYTTAGSESVEENADRSHGMIRTEVICQKCGAHLGHVFEDGPEPTGLRYCINSLSLDFEKKK